MPGTVVVHQLVVWAFIGLLGWAAWSDFRRLLIPNRISIAIVALFPAYALAAGLTPSEIGAAALCAAGLFALGVVLFARGWIGGGDAKLLAATALWAGGARLADFVVITTLAGAALALLLYVPRRLSAYLPALVWLEVPVGAGAAARPAPAQLPYGIAIAAGGVYLAFTILRG